MRVEIVREVTGDRLDRLKRLFDDVRAHDGHEALGEHKWLDLVHGGRTGFAGVIVEEDGREVGYAHLSRHRDATPAHWGLEVVVHPAHREGDVGSRLLDRSVAVIREAGGGHVHLWMFQPSPVQEKIAAEHGFARGRDLLHMRIALPPTVRADLPAGVRLRSFDPARDEDAWLELNNAAFEHHPEQGAWDLATFRRRMQEPWFDAQDLLIAEDETGIIGSNWTKLDHERRVGEIYVIAVCPSRHGSGLGKALSIAGLEHMTGRGMREGALYVDAGNASAVRLYEKIGFTVDHRDRAFVADIP